MKIKAFKLTSDTPGAVLALIDAIANMKLEDRVRITAYGDVSLKEIRSSGTSARLLDFTKFRLNGPGRAPKGRPNEDFDLQADEFFGEEAAGVYYDDTSTLILQYNHYGPRPSSIGQYLNSFAASLMATTPGLYDYVDLRIVLKEDQRKKLQEMKFIKSLNVRVHLPGVLQQPNLKKMSLFELFQKPVLPGVETVKLELKAARSKSLDVTDVKSIIDELTYISDNVTELKVSGAERDDETATVLNLLGAQLETDLPMAPASRKRDGLASRLQVIRSVYDQWRANGWLSGP